MTWNLSKILENLDFHTPKKNASLFFFFPLKGCLQNTTKINSVYSVCALNPANSRWIYSLWWNIYILKYHNFIARCVIKFTFSCLDRECGGLARLGLGWVISIVKCWGHCYLFVMVTTPFHSMTSAIKVFIALFARALSLSLSLLGREWLIPVFRASALASIVWGKKEKSSQTRPVRQTAFLLLFLKNITSDKGSTDGEQSYLKIRLGN